MSFNQSRAEKSEVQLRKSRRSGGSGHHRGFSGTGKGGAAAPPPQSSSSNAQSLSSNRSFKKLGNVQGGQSRVNPVTAGSESAAAVQNGACAQGPSHGSSDAPAPGGTKPFVAPRDCRARPEALSSQPAAGASDSAAPLTPTKEDAARQFMLHFGTISPGVMNGMQIPARTSSAPPNLDEQRRDQALQESFRAVPTFPLPAAPKPQQARKDLGAAKQAIPEKSHPQSQAKGSQVQVQAASSVAPPRSVLPVAGAPMSMPFQQSPVPLQFGGPNIPMQPLSVTASSLQMPLAFHVGGAPQVPQQMFVPGLQSHPMQPQAMIHQGHGFGFAPQMGHKLPPQLGNMGITIGSQFAQQQPGTLVGQRKTTVKITHPETHEELRLEKRTDSYMDGGSSGQRPLSNITPQSQPHPTFASSHQISYYSSLQPNSYGSSPIIYPTATSVPVSSTQMTLAPRHSYPVDQSGHPIPFIIPSVSNPIASSKAGPSPLQGVLDSGKIEATSVSVLSSSVQVSTRPYVGSYVDKDGKSSVIITVPTNKAEASDLLKPSAEVTASHQQKESEVHPDSSVQQPKSVPESSATSQLVSDRQSATVSTLPLQVAQPETPATAPVVPGAEGKKKEPVRKNDSFKEHRKRPGKKDLECMQLQRQEEEMDTLNSGGSVNLTLSKTINDSSRADDNDNVFRTAEVSEGEKMPAVLLPDRVALNKEALQTASLGSSGTSKSNMSGVCALDNDYAETDTSSVLPREETASKHLDSSIPQDDHTLIAEVQAKSEILALIKPEKNEVSNDLLEDNSIPKVHLIFMSAESAGSVEPVASANQEIGVEDAGKADFCRSHDAERQKLDTCRDGERHGIHIDQEPDKLARSVLSASDNIDTESNSYSHLSSTIAEIDKFPLVDAKMNKVEVTDPRDGGLSGHADRLVETTSMEAQVSSGTAQRQEGGAKHLLSENQVSTRAKTATVKKKLKEILSKADAAGSSDLYNAYKGPVEKHEAAGMSDQMDISATVDIKDVSVNDKKEVVENEDDGPHKGEVDDWEDAADIATPKLRTSGNGHQADGTKEQHSAPGNRATNKKKYSKDFLLTFLAQYTQLPLGFEIGSDIVNALMSSPLPASSIVDLHSPGRNMDRHSGGSWVDRRMAGITDDDKWMKSSGSFGPGQDYRLDIGHGAPGMNFRSGQGINHGVLRNPRGHASSSYAGRILSGPHQSLPCPGGVSQNGADADRWQRASIAQRGLIPSPQTPLQVMHKADKKYEICIVTDEEEVKQRQLKAILNKLTPQKFEKLFAQVKEVNIDNTVTLTGVISQIFDKALMEPTFCEMYANFCLHLAAELPDFSENNEKITFRRLLLSKCQEEFERGEREQAEAKKAEEEGEIQQSEEQREEMRLKARRRMLGNIRLIGELYKKKMLTERIMHECIKKLLGQYQNPDEEDIEALCKLMSTIGEMIDHPKAKEHMDAYFDMMLKLSNNQNLSSRVRFMLKDAIDLRKNKWQQRRKVEGPRKIEEVHRDAAFERQAQAGRSSRGPVSASSSRWGGYVDFRPKVTTELSMPSSQMGGSRGLPLQLRGCGSQDIRFEDKHVIETQTLSVPLPQRPDDDSITLGPQGGLARGMSMRGQPLISNVPLLAEIPSTGSNSWRTRSGQNGCISPLYSTREEAIPRHKLDRLAGVACDQPSIQGRMTYSGTRDSINAPPSGRMNGSTIGSQHVHSEAMPLSEEYLRYKSISTVREYYSAKDVEEVALCVKELNTPSFYPIMISLWITDSFERKDMERDLLVSLLVKLSKPQDSLLNQMQLIQGFEHVLSSLEDAMNDAPKAAEFLGRLFARVILENVVILREIGRLIHEGGEEPGQLLEVGLASEVLGSILEFIKLEKGDSVLNDMLADSTLRLEDFRPPHPMKAKKLEAFIRT